MTLFLGNLNFKSGEKEIRSFLKGFGVIETVDVKFDRDGRSKGFGYVTF